MIRMRRWRKPDRLTFLILKNLLGAFLVAVTAGGNPVRGEAPSAVLVSLPAPEKLPLWREGSQRTGPPVPPEPPKRLLFGLGVGFERSGNAMGVPLAQVLAGSPADRAGLTPGTIIAEINGETTVGKIGDACAQMIRDSAGTVTLKLYDPATLKLRTITVEKAAIVLP